MAVLKCKMCGGDLEITEGMSVCECEYCGTKQTILTSNDENMQNLFNRANTMRMKIEFDKAEQWYDKIIQADDTQAEAYWGLVLCKYGIEYVEDPVTYKRIPTCHRTSYESVLTDENYKAALAHADVVQRSIYEAEAKEIDRLQKEILEQSQKEEAYDVFICYKEKDENGNRTQDSVLANDIYHHLTQEGYKVFYAAITLEDKLGSAYEPCIFAALNSAKVMLALGTKPEYFTAVWVKNEWSRYMKFMASDRSKMLIPCYRNMDAYDLPEEFAHLQAQDMSKIGFISDIVRGIQKVIPKAGVQNVVTTSAVATDNNSKVEPLLKRAFMFLEDGDWTSADEYCEKVLDIEPECAEAYLGKLMAELKIRNKEILKDHDRPFDNFANYQKAVRFSNASLKKELEDCIEFIKTRNIETKYQQSVEMMGKANDEKAYTHLESRFRNLGDYKDSKELMEQCIVKAEEIRVKQIYDAGIREMQSAQSEEQYLQAALRFKEILTYKNAKELVEICRKKAEECRKNEIYKEALVCMNAETFCELTKAIGKFNEIYDWKDSREKIIECQNKIEVVRNQIYEEALKCMKSGTFYELASAIGKFNEIYDWKDSKEKVIECQKKIRDIKVREEEKRIEEKRIEAEMQALKAEQKKKIGFLIAAVVIVLASICVFII